MSLYFKGIEYEYKPINLLKGEQRSEEYKLVNPNGKLPCLVVGGVPISQSVSILEYLEEVYPEKPLLPQDPLQRAIVRMITQTIVSDIQPLQNTLALDIPVEKRQDWSHKIIKEGFERLEIMLNAHAGIYCVGDTVTLADVALVPQIYNAKRFSVDLSPTPTLLRIYESLMLLDMFLETAPEKMIDCPPV